MSDPKDPEPQTVLMAVVKELRTELKLINPDYRRCGRMVADGLEAVLDWEQEAGIREQGATSREQGERIPAAVEVRQPGPVEVRARKARRSSDRSDRSE